MLYNIFSPLSELPQNDDYVYVTDGDHLLYKVPLKSGTKYSYILDNYVKYLRLKYGINIVVVFYGYGVKMCTKQAKRPRCDYKNKQPSTNVIFKDNMDDVLCNMVAKEFFSNRKNLK